MKISDILKTLSAVAKSAPAAAKLITPEALVSAAGLYESYEKAQAAGNGKLSSEDKVALGIQGVQFLSAQGITLDDIAGIATAAAPVLAASIK